MTASPKLVVLCDQEYNPQLGPTGYNGWWEAELAVQLHDGSIAKVGTKVSDHSIADYSSNSRGWCKVELYALGDGWLVKVIAMSMEMGAGEWEGPTERWFGSADATMWRKLGAADELADGTLIDTLETPASDRSIYA